MKWFKRLVIISGIAVLALVLLSGGAVLYTNRSNFCTSCHYMQPYYDAWVQSSHRDVPCAACHYPPGVTSVVKGKIRDLNQLVKYATNAYRRSKPWAEIEDASCLRPGCHETRLLEGQVDFGGVKFDHRPHLTEMRRGKKLRCTSCHSQIVQGEHISVTATTCVICHFKERGETDVTANCTLCHDPPIGPEAKFDHSSIQERDVECRMCHGEMIVGDGAVPKEQCYACHYERERLEQYDNHELMHSIHITRSKIECERCHYPMQHKERSAEERLSPTCNSCHQEYHTAQVDLFSGTGGYGPDPLPNPMLEHGLSCQSCHVFHETAVEFPENGESMIARGESCELCHGKGYSRILSEWKTASGRQEDVIESSLAALDRALARASGAKRKAVQSTIEAARHNYLLVRHGKAVHNIEYADQVLAAAYDSLSAAAQKLGGVRLPRMIRLAEKTPGECSNCHFGIEHIKTDAFGIHFDHNKHVSLQGLPCTTCHSNMRRHGELVVSRDNCLSCHHKPENPCGTCHETQYRLRHNDDSPIPLDSADMMLEAGVECRDCHENADGTITKVTALRCVNCHDEGYVRVLDEWQTEVRSKIDEIDRIVRGLSPNALGPESRERYEEIAKTLRVIRADKSTGAHNYMAINSLLDQRLAEARALSDLTGKSP